jgi:hypothetical protein
MCEAWASLRLSVSYRRAFGSVTLPHTAAFYDWKSRVGTLFDTLKPHHRDILAEYSFGMVLARGCGLTSVVAYRAAFLAVKLCTLRQRLRELDQPASAPIGSARSAFDFTLCFAPLIRWAAADQPDQRRVIALDPTCLTDRFRVLGAAVLYRGCGLPVAWAVQTADQKGSWNDLWFDLLGKLKAALGDDWTVLVLTDRGLESADLFRAVVRLGWHPLMRVKAGGKFQPSTWQKGYFLNTFAREVGCQWSGEGVAYPTGDRLACTRLASWDEGHDEPWRILTDLPTTGTNPVWYAWRMGIEQGFRAIKRGGWQWHQTQMSDPARVARLWAVIAVATVYPVEVGGEAEPADLPRIAKKWSTLKRGLLRIWLAFRLREPLPKGKIEHHAWPKSHAMSDPLAEPYVHKG